MKKLIITSLVLIIFATSGIAQQDPMFTKYMFNSLVFNPAYAGAKEHFSATLLHRDQWWGIEGAPLTQSLTIHSPLESGKVGLGLSLVNDQIGPMNTLNMMGSYAYRIQMGQGTLAVGLQAGVMNWRADFNKLSLDNEVDAAYMNSMTPNMWLPNFGAGLYYAIQNKFYAGISAPNLLPNGFREDAPIMAQQFRHYYFMTGGAVRLNSSMVFKPSLLIKNVGLFGAFQNDEIAQMEGIITAPTEFDIDASILFYDALWLGVAFRSAFEGFNGSSSFDSGDIWVSYYLRNGLRIGAAYDFTLTELRPFAQGSFEIMLGYEMNYKEKQIVTPRYF